MKNSGIERASGLCLGHAVALVLAERLAEHDGQNAEPHVEASFERPLPVRLSVGFRKTWPTA
jgi:hypothetical protein